VREDIAKAVESVENAKERQWASSATEHATISIAYSLIAIAALLEDMNDMTDRGPA
jgi:hypothetical protein